MDEDRASRLALRSPGNISTSLLKHPIKLGHRFAPWICHDLATRLQRIFLVFTNYWLIMLARRCWPKGMLKSCCRIYIPSKNDVFLYFFYFFSICFDTFPWISHEIVHIVQQFPMVFHEFPIKRMFSYGLPRVSHEISTPPWPRMQLADPRRPGCTHWSLDTNKHCGFVLYGFYVVL